MTVSRNSETDHCALQPANFSTEPHDRSAIDVAVLPILYQDKWLVAINKPAGMLVHRSFLDKHETVFVLQTLRNQLGQHVFPLHRLDRPTSGVLLFALSAEIAAQVSQQQVKWQKYYLATVRGYMQHALQLDYPLFEELDAIADKYADSDKEAQTAVTAIYPLAQMALPIVDRKFTSSRYSLLLLQPFTGRKHQLRRHLAHLFHPILGDTTHGDNKNNRRFSEFAEINRLQLHAWLLCLQHPVTGEPLKICAGLPDFTEFWCGWGASLDEDKLKALVESQQLTQLPMRLDVAKEK
jgi:tRNA pseudouridine65 synthase